MLPIPWHPKQEERTFPALTSGERAKVQRSGPGLSSPQARVQFHLVYNSSCDAHAIEDRDIDDCRHSSIVDGLGAVGPHVGTLSQIYVAGAQTETKNTVLEYSALENTKVTQLYRENQHTGPEPEKGLLAGPPSAGIWEL